MTPSHRVHCIRALGGEVWNRGILNRLFYVFLLVRFVSHRMPTSRTMRPGKAYIRDRRTSSGARVDVPGFSYKQSSHPRLTDLRSNTREARVVIPRPGMSDLIKKG